MTRPAVRRGEIWLANWPRRLGSEQRGLRPSLVIQNDEGNDNGNTTIVAAISTSWRPYPFIVPITSAQSGLPRDSAVNLSQVQTIDRLRLIRRVGRLEAAVMILVNQSLRVSLDIPDA